MAFLRSRKSRFTRRAVLGFEQLEDRQLLNASNPFAELQTEVAPFLNQVSSAIDTIVDGANAKLPIIDKSLSELTGAQDVVSTLGQVQDKVDAALDFIKTVNDPNQLEMIAENKLYELLGPGANGIGVVNSPADVDVQLDTPGKPVVVVLDLGKSFNVGGINFGLGLDGLPFRASGAVTLDVGFHLNDLTFGLVNNNGSCDLFLQPGTFSLDVTAQLPEGMLSGELGFLTFSAMVPPTPSGQLAPNHFIGAFEADLDLNEGLKNARLTGNAHVELDLHAGFVGDPGVAPGISATFVLDWGFDASAFNESGSSFGDTLNVEFKDVQLSLGSFVTQLIGPVVQKVQEFTAPFNDFFQFLADPLPVVSDLAKVIGDNDGVSLLDLASIAQGTGGIPEPYNTIITVAKIVIPLTNTINDIQLAVGPGGQLEAATLDFGDFNLGDTQGTDLRDIAAHPDFGNLSAPNWSNLQNLASNINLEPIKEQLAKLGDVGGALNNALDELKAGFDQSNGNGIDLQFPIVDDPAGAIFGLLIGQDSPLATFHAQLNLDSGELSTTVFDFYGLKIELYGGINVDAKLDLGYDTYGLRSIVVDALNGSSPNFLDLVDGFYVGSDTHLRIEATIGVRAGVNYVVLDANVSGHLDGFVDIRIPELTDKDGDGDADDPTDVNGDGKVRIRDHAQPNETEFNPMCPFEISGGLSAGLDVNVRIGIGELSVKHSIALAEGEIGSFHVGCVDPFAAPQTLQLAEPDPNDETVLRLNVGPWASERGFMTDVENETYDVYPSDPEPGDDPDGIAVIVSAFGKTQRFDGVRKIYADAGSSRDVIRIDPGVNADVELHGGADNDTLIAPGKGFLMAGANGSIVLHGEDGDDALQGGEGLTTIYGGLGNDTIEAGPGDAILYGGDGILNAQADGNDHITGGPGINAIDGENGNDQLFGGIGFNIIAGRDGNDRLVGGPLDDYLDAGFGDDLLEATPGYDYLYGDRGNDHFVWRFESSDPAGQEDDGATDIDGGGDKDTVALYGSTKADVFTLSRSPLASGYAAVIVAPHAKFGSVPVRTRQLENVIVEGLQGVDDITVNDLTGTDSIREVGINLGDLVKNNYGLGDGVVDNVLVRGTAEVDNVNVAAEKVLIQVPEHGDEPLFGGVTSFTGLPVYRVRTANVQDDVQLKVLQGNDTVNVYGITGPTLIRGDGSDLPVGSDNDTFNVYALEAGKYAAELNLDADGGQNQLLVSEPGTTPDTIVVTSDRIESGLLGAVNYVAKDGDYTLGVTVSSGQGNDHIDVRNTLPNVTTRVNTGKGNDYVYVSSGLANGTLAAIQGTLAVDAGEGTGNVLELNDIGATSGNAVVSIQPNKVLGLAGPTDQTQVGYTATLGQLALIVHGSNAANVNERFIVQSPAAGLTLNGHGGDEVFQVSSLTRPAAINGGEGNDMTFAGYATNNLSQLQGALLVNGGTGWNNLVVTDTAAPTGQAYTLQANTLSRTGAVDITFDGTTNWLDVSTSPFADMVTVAAVPTPQMVNIHGIGGSNTLTGPNAGAEWMVNNPNSGMLGMSVQFNQFQNLKGGTGADRFQLYNGMGVAGTIDGGSGNDVLDHAYYTTSVSVNLQTKAATGTGGVNAVEEFVGGAQADMLIGTNTPNQWQVDGVDRGQVNTIGSGIFRFRSFENLTGGTASDNFAFSNAGQLSGAVNGLGGTNALNYSLLSSTNAVRVNLATGAASRILGGVTNLQDVTGSQGNDVIQGNGQINKLFGLTGNDVLVGGDGADLLDGASGRDIVIGGLAADTLLGGTDEDVLIAGRTTHDGNLAALLALQAEWGMATPYGVRRANLIAGVGPGNAFKLNATTVQDDGVGVVDALTGGADARDWFWANLGEISDLNQPFGEFVGA